MIEDIFCKIINKERETETVMETKDWLAIKDINPKAPVHILIMPKKHLTGLSGVSKEERHLLGELMLAVGKVAKALGLTDNGYRVIINHGRDGGQVVPHLHLHLLGGKVLGPKMVK